MALGAWICEGRGSPSPPSCPRLSRASTPWRQSKAWMARTSPAMTTVGSGKWRKSLLLLLRADRFPVRARQILRELPGPVQKLGRGRVVVGGAGELLRRADKIAGTVAGKALAIGLRAGQQLRRDLAGFAERFVDPHRLRAPLDADGV